MRCPNLQTLNVSVVSSWQLLESFSCKWCPYLEDFDALRSARDQGKLLDASKSNNGHSSVEKATRQSTGKNDEYNEGNGKLNCLTRPDSG